MSSPSISLEVGDGPLRPRNIDTLTNAIKTIATVNQPEMSQREARIIDMPEVKNRKSFERERQRKLGLWVPLGIGYHHVSNKNATAKEFQTRVQKHYRNQWQCCSELGLRCHERKLV
jgi:hypothetical protein